jgi:hypothetical protein
MMLIASIVLCAAMAVCWLALPAGKASSNR